MLHGMLILLVSLASLGPLSFSDSNTPDPWAPCHHAFLSKSTKVKIKSKLHVVDCDQFYESALYNLLNHLHPMFQQLNASKVPTCYHLFRNMLCIGLLGIILVLFSDNLFTLNHSII